MDMDSYRNIGIAIYVYRSREWEGAITRLGKHGGRERREENVEYVQVSGIVKMARKRRVLRGE